MRPISILMGIIAMLDISLINPKKWERNVDLKCTYDQINRYILSVGLALIIPVYYFVMYNRNYAELIVSSFIFVSYLVISLLILLSRSCEFICKICILRWIVNGGVVSTIYGVYPDLRLQQIVLLVVLFLEPPLLAYFLFFNKNARAVLEGASQSPSMRRWHKRNDVIIRSRINYINILFSLIFTSLAIVYSMVAWNEFHAWYHNYTIYVIIDILKNLFTAVTLLAPSRIIVNCTVSICVIFSIYSFSQFDDIGVIRHVCINVPVCAAIILYLLFSDKVRLQAFRQVRA